MLDQVLKAIRERHRFVVTSHSRPDGDGIGSALACGQILRAMGKDAEVVTYDGVPRIYQNLPFAGRAIHAESVPSNDAVILLECDSTRRAGLHGLDQCFLINIDHHVSGRNFAHINWIDASVMATAELVYRLARRACVPIDRDIATCLYTALMTDTGSFMFEGTNEHTFAVARELVVAGANPALCARPIYFGHSTAKMRLLGAALSHLHREGPLAWIWVTQEQMERFGAREEDCEGLVNYALSMGDVQVAIFFRELSDKRYRVSLRSKGGINVSKVAEHFGGGGHKCASGFSVDGPLAVAVSRVVDRLRTEPVELNPSSD
ncbi:MAG TPA: bifunctional oligoribonuclease/PAP phosphatase NrnA [Terriglobales bacterium]|nr:bifunctional oligoribonuclease/PAP phosphatase NrnA [Terriglobales bacterium]